jgi:hypothetical protein
MSNHNSIINYEALLNLSKFAQKEYTQRGDAQRVIYEQNKTNYEVLLNLTKPYQKGENKITNANLEAKLEPNLEAKLETKLETKLEPNLETKLETKLEPSLEASLEASLEPDTKKEDHIFSKKIKTKFNLDKINKINKNISEEYKVLKDTIKIDELIEKITNNINLDIIELVNIYKSNDKNIANTSEIFLLKFLKKIQENRVF